MSAASIYQIHSAFDRGSFFVRFRPRAAVAALLSLVFLCQGAPIPAVLAAISGQAFLKLDLSEARGLSPRGSAAIAFASAPQRIPVKEPARTRHQAPPASAMRANAVQGIRAHGVRGVGPPMLRPMEIDRVLSAARARSQRPAASKTLTPPSRTASKVPAVDTKPGVRRAQSLPSDAAASGTGINRWWRYQEQNVPGGGHVMVNVGTGNMLLQDDDMSIPHRGITLALRRTYNSQSGHDVNATDAAGLVYEPAGMYGNGWTNTFDAHIARNASLTVYTVFDIDGGRYDYDAAWPAGNPNGVFTPRAGNHATLAYDGLCGYLWTKKSGTTYYFYAPGLHAPCPQTGGTTEGYAGKLYEILGRNRNTFLTFTYSWDGGVSSLTGKISQINVQTESGLNATLAFSDVNGHRLLSQLTYPDGVTAVFYGYDGQGNLTSVSTPENNSSGARPVTWYGYQALGTGWLMLYTASPRWTVGCSAGCGTDGGILEFAFAGLSNASSTVTSIWHEAVVNPSVADGTNAPLQNGYSTTASWYLGEYYATGGTTPTLRDTDGHMTNWVVDGMGRPTQTQACTLSVNQGQQCTGTWLVTNESWDANNNLTGQVDARGNETDYAYDANGNTVAIGQPAVSTIDGILRPTALYTYDAFNNITAYCDPMSTHLLGLDWPALPSPNDTLCPQSNVGATRVSYVYPSYEPYGEVSVLAGPATSASPNGYNRSFSYAQNAAADYGQPIGITGDVVTQSSGSIQPQQTFSYDQHGNVVCYNNGVGIWLIRYDALGRQTAVADPDDGSIQGCGKPASSKATATYYSYYPSGALAYDESPIQHAADIVAGNTTAAHTLVYDLDGDLTAETHHFGCITASSCPLGTVNKAYDGAGRLVEIQQPHDDKFDGHPYRWMQRYLYDLSAGSTVNLSLPPSSSAPGTATTSFRAFGNLYDTQTWVDLGWSSDDSAPRWVDHLGTSYDGLDRKTASYDMAVGTAPVTSMAFDATPTTLGYQSSQTRGSGESITNDYDPAGRLASETFSGDGGVTPARSYQYDAKGNVRAISSSLGTEQLAYDNLGNVVQHTEPVSLGGTTLTYGYTGNGLKSSLSVRGGINKELFQYSYRADGKLTNELVNGNSGWQPFTWTYTPAGLLLQRTDPATASAITELPNPPPAVNAPVHVGISSVFGPLTYTLDNRDAITAVQYSDGYTVGNIVTDLEGGTTAFNDSLAYSSATNKSTYTHNSVPINYTVRDEVGSIGPTMSGVVNAYNSGSIWAEANGIRLPTAFKPSGSISKYYPLVEASPDATFTTPVNPLDGNEMSSSGYENTPANPMYTNNIVYDAAGRSTSNDLQECSTDSSANSTETETLSQTRYDAENHTISSLNFGSSAPGCVFGGQWASQYSWTYDWGMNGHPSKITYTSQTYGTSNHRYLHWDGDVLLFTSYTPDGAPDDIKIGSFADLIPGDGDIAVYDRDSAGNILDSHTTQTRVYDGLVASTPYNDLINGAILQTCGSGGDCTFVSEPTPDSLSGYLGFSIQGQRGVDNNTGHWTTPDAFAGVPGDPESQMPYMFERNNSYKYSDPTGYCIEDACVGEGLVVVGVAEGVAEVAALAGDEALAISIRGGISAARYQAAIQFQRLGGWTSGAFRTAVGRLRIADHLDAEAKELGEAKDVAYQYLSSQIKDQIAHAGSKSYMYILRIRAGTKLSKPLQQLMNDLIKQGKAKIQRIGGPSEDVHP